MLDHGPCPVCRSARSTLDAVGDIHSVVCPHCGAFSISGSALAVVPTLIGADKRRATLVGYVLRRMQRTNRRPRLTSDSLKRTMEKEKLPTPDVQADNLIRWLGDNTEPGRGVTISPRTHGAIVGFTNTEGVHLILRGLQEEHLIRWHAVFGPKQSVELTKLGWTRHQDLAASIEQSHRVAAVLSSDVVGYSTLIATDEGSTLAALAVCTSMLRDAVERHGGRVVKTTGDGTLNEFGSTFGAMKAALEIQSAMEQQNAGRLQSKRVVLRLGLAVGDVFPDGDDIMGDAVNLADHLQSAATPGTIYTVEHVRDDLANRIELISADLGPQELKGIGRPVRIVRIIPR